MRVLFVNHTGLVSGAEHSLLTLIDGLPREVVCGLACPAGPLTEMARERGIDVYPVRGTAGSLRLHPWHTTVALTEIVRSGFQVARAARETGASVLHANSLRAALVAGVARRLRKRGLVTHVRDCLPNSASTRLIRRLVARETDEVIAISEYVAERFRSGLSGYEASVRVIDNPVDLRRFRAVAPRARDADAAPVLAIVGQITPWKGHETAIRALAELRRHHPHARLLIVGEVKFTAANTRMDTRGYLVELRRLVADLALGDAVEFVGERDDVPEIMARADAILAPSTEEPFGRTVAEGMAIGTPVIATSVGGPAELIEDGVSGTLVPPGDPAAWAEAIAHVLTDPERAKRMADRARAEAARRFDPRAHVAALERVYAEVSRFGP